MKVTKAKKTSSGIAQKGSNLIRHPGPLPSFSTPGFKHYDHKPNTDPTVASERLSKLVPSFILMYWKKTVIPMLYHDLYLSEYPCTMLTKGATLISMVERIINEVVPKQGYRVINDKCLLYQAAYYNLKNAQKSIQKAVLTSVGRHFEGKTHDYVKVYTAHALQIDRPAFFSDANILGVVFGDMKYKKPHKLYTSQFIVETISPFWPLLSTGDCIEYPIGLLALGAAAIEYAFDCYVTGYIRTIEISDNNVESNTALEEYSDTVNILRDTQWEEIACACSIISGLRVRTLQVTVDPEWSVKTSRRLLYVPIDE
ncbi:hypothetical protein BDQ17DRAFT_1422802 [Cyathus striatus]|nr:hypothetical protein BDQ17DRAFT_1422802 [Cyathus striatus]